MIKGETARIGKSPFLSYLLLNPICMIKANLDDKSLVADILTAAFLHNKSVNYLIPQDGLTMFRIHELIRYSFEICLLFGEVFLCEDRKGCVLLLYPELKRTTFRSVWLDLKLILKGIGLNNVLSGKTG